LTGCDHFLYGLNVYELPFAIRAAPDRRYQLQEWVKGVPEQLLVPFAGEGSGVGELSWGQQTIWRGIVGRDGRPIWLPGLEPIASGKTVQDVARLLTFMMSRYQSLRTRLLVSEDGHVQQMVASSGEIALQIVDAADEADPLAVSRELQAQWLTADIDWPNEWLVKMAVVRHRGVPRYRVTAMCHIVTDGFGMLVLMAECNHLAVVDREKHPQPDPIMGIGDGPVTAMEPLEQAQWQASPAGKRRSAIAEQYWERVLQAIPPRMFPPPTEPRTPRYAQIRLKSRAAYLATQLIAARTGADTSPVLLAAFAVALNRVCGVNPAVPRVLVNNRFRSRLAASVSPIAQSCPCPIDLAGITTFDEAVKRAFTASIAAFKHAYFEPATIREIVASVSAERGVTMDMTCVYNDMRMNTPREAAASPPAPGEVRAAQALTKLGWEDQDANDPCHIQIIDCRDAIEIVIAIDSEHVPADAVEAVLREMDAVMVRAATGPSAAATG
jgi:Condensation domain